MTEFVLVLHFVTAGFSAAIAPVELRAAYKTVEECQQDVPKIYMRWLQTGLPAPQAITCEAHPGVAHARY